PWPRACRRTSRTGSAALRSGISKARRCPSRAAARWCVPGHPRWNLQPTVRVGCSQVAAKDNTAWPLNCLMNADLQAGPWMPRIQQLPKFGIVGRTHRSDTSRQHRRYLPLIGVMKEQERPEAVVETVPEDPSRPDGATEMYLIFDGRRIAKRGKPGTLHAMTWISLEPGVVVRDVPTPESESGWGIVIEINNVRVH